MPTNINQKPTDIKYLDDLPVDDPLRINVVKEIVDNAHNYGVDTDDPDTLKNSKDPHKQEFYYAGIPVYAYRDLLKGFRQNVKVSGYWFDVDTFENLIDCFVPKENIPVILRCNGDELDKFCLIVYGMKFNETYKVLSGISDMFMRKSIKGHSDSGNPTAMKIAAEHFMDLREQNNKDAINITVYNDLGNGVSEE